MALTLRPTERASPAFAHLADWNIVEDGEVIGRIYETHAPFLPELAWYWSLQAMGPARRHVRCEGNGATLDQAKAAFAASLHAFKAWSP